jgi:uncharacterized protein YjdB
MWVAAGPFGGWATNLARASAHALLDASYARDTAEMQGNRWCTLVFMSLASGLGCADDDAGRFGPDGYELAEYRFDPQSLSLSTDTVTLSVDERLTLTAAYRDEDSVRRDVSAEAQWSSDDPTIAWVQQGQIIGVFPGLAHVSVRHAGLTASASVAITAQNLEAITVLPGAQELASGTSASLRALGVFRGDVQRDITPLVRWRSSDEAVALLDGNVVYARAPGTATLEASLNDITGSAEITVGAARLLDLAIVPLEQSLAVGTKQQLRAQGSFSDQQTLDVTELSDWSSDDGNLATVDDAGWVSAHSSGELGIWARFQGHAAQTTVTIQD